MIYASVSYPVSRQKIASALAGYCILAHEELTAANDETQDERLMHAFAESRACLVH